LRGVSFEPKARWGRLAMLATAAVHNTWSVSPEVQSLKNEIEKGAASCCNGTPASASAAKALSPPIEYMALFQEHLAGKGHATMA
jgi:hypothetical protein